ncbi:MAG: hypothetical protein ACOZNI_29760 [Myxococcota bacterium]
MRDFNGRAGMLARMETGTKLVYSSFVVLTVLGLLTAALLHGDGMGLDDAATYWRGDDTEMAYPKSYRQLLELTHFHLFTEPVTFLVLAHLYNLSGDAPRRKVVAVASALLAMVAQIALPWAITYGGAAFAVAFVPAHVLLTVSLLYMSGAALVEMWWPSSP